MKKAILMCMMVLLFGGPHTLLDTLPKEDDTTNIWYRQVGNKVLELDMSKGYAACNGPEIMILVVDRVSGELIAMIFANGTYFYADRSYWGDGNGPIAPPAENETLEQYLNRKKGEKCEKIYK